LTKEAHEKNLLVVAAVVAAMGCSDRTDTSKLEIERKAVAAREMCITDFKLKGPPKMGLFVDVGLMTLNGCYEPNPNAFVIAKCTEIYAQNRKDELERQEKAAWDACPGPNSYIPMDKYLAH